MTLAQDYPAHFNENARLIILRELSQMNDYRLLDTLLQQVLDSFAMDRGREYLLNQLNWLAETAGAVRLTQAGDNVVAELTSAGLEHVERKRILVGVKRPSARQAV